MRNHDVRVLLGVGCLRRLGGFKQFGERKCELVFVEGGDD